MAEGGNDVFRDATVHDAEYHTYIHMILRSATPIRASSLRSTLERNSCLAEHADLNISVKFSQEVMKEPGHSGDAAFRGIQEMTKVRTRVFKR